MKYKVDWEKRQIGNLFFSRFREEAAALEKAQERFPDLGMFHDERVTGADRQMIAFPGQVGGVHLAL